MLHKPLPTLEYLAECFVVDSNVLSGLIWKHRPRSHFPHYSIWRTFLSTYSGKMAGYDTGKRHYQVAINQKLFKTYRIVWALANGRDPGDYEIDHIDGNPLNNDPSNLRLASRGQNAQNTGLRRDNKTGHAGLNLAKNGKWIASIRFSRHTYHLGCYADFETAMLARRRAEVFFFGDFAPSARSGQPETISSHDAKLPKEEFIAALKAELGVEISTQEIRQRKIRESARRTPTLEGRGHD